MYRSATLYHRVTGLTSQPCGRGCSPRLRDCRIESAKFTEDLTRHRARWLACAIWPKWYSAPGRSGTPPNLRAALTPGIIRLYTAALLAVGVGSWFGYRAARWTEIKILVQAEITFTVLGALAGLYAAFVAGAPAFNWLATGVFVGFGVAWILLYRRAEA